MDEQENPVADERIEVGYRNVGSVLGKDYYHKYLLYTDREGNQQTISGWTGDETPGLPYGRMQVETNLPYDASNPDHPSNPNATGQRQHQELITTGADLSDTWRNMVASAQANDDRYPYDPQLQNSNTLADSVLRSVDLPQPRDDGFFGHWAPASGRTLDENIQPSVPALGNSGRTFSAIDQPSETRHAAVAPEVMQDIRNPDHVGHVRYAEALDAIERSPNISPGTFTGERLHQAAANLADTSLTGAERPQGGRNEVLDRIDFAVFNEQRDGLLAGQGDWKNSTTAKFAYMTAEQDNATNLTVASQQVHDTLQRTQAQSVEISSQSVKNTHEQDNASIGPRLA